MVVSERRCDRIYYTTIGCVIYSQTVDKALLLQGFAIVGAAFLI